MRICEPTLRKSNEPIQIHQMQYHQWDKILNHYVELYDFNATFVAVSSVRNQYGSDQLAGIVFFMNPETGTYLILEGNAQYACVLSVGNNLDFDITHEEIMGILLGGGT